MATQVKPLAKAQGVLEDFVVLQGMRQGKGAEEHLSDLCDLSLRLKREVLGIDQEDGAGLRHGLGELARLVEQAPPEERALLQMAFNIARACGNHDWMDRAESYGLDVGWTSRKVRDRADIALVQLLVRSKEGAEREPAPVDTRETISLSERVRQVRASDFFSEDYVRNSSRFMESWKNARTVDMCGFGHNRMTVAFSGEIGSLLKSGGRIRVLMQDPDGQAVLEANERSSTPKASPEQVRHQHRSGIATLEAIQLAADAPAESVQLRVYDIMPPFTGYFFDTDDESAHAYIWFWSWRQPSSWRPGFYIARAHDKLWHSRFSDQFDEMWSDSKTTIVGGGESK